MPNVPEPLFPWPVAPAAPAFSTEPVVAVMAASAWAEDPLAFPVLEWTPGTAGTAEIAGAARCGSDQVDA